jgi:AraC-like DNA-binding protein
MVKSLILTVCVFSIFLPVAIGQDLSVEELLNNLKTDNYTGKPVDLELEDGRIETLFSRLEKFSGLSLELSPKIPKQFPEKKTYRFKQVPWDRILSLVLGELHLEAIPMDGTVYIQPIENNMMRIIREDNLQSPKSSRIHLLLFLLTALVLAGGTTGLLLYRKRKKSEKTSSGGFVIDPDKADEIMKRVTYLFEVEKVYRKEDISLQILSEILSIPSYQLSWIINKKMGITFSGLLNFYRVEEVKKRLASSRDDGRTILDIAFDAGFNTKTSFNRVFKKLTRMTPSEYRRRNKVPN